MFRSAVTSEAVGIEHGSTGCTNGTGEALSETPQETGLWKVTAGPDDVDVGSGIDDEELLMDCTRGAGVVNEKAPGFPLSIFR